MHKHIEPILMFTWSLISLFFLFHYHPDIILLFYKLLLRRFLGTLLRLCPLIYSFYLKSQLLINQILKSLKILRIKSGAWGYDIQLIIKLLITNFPHLKIVYRIFKLRTHVRIFSNCWPYQLVKITFIKLNFSKNYCT